MSDKSKKQENLKKLLLEWYKEQTKLPNIVSEPLAIPNVYVDVPLLKKIKIPKYDFIVNIDDDKYTRYQTKLIDLRYVDLIVSPTKPISKVDLYNMTIGLLMENLPNELISDTSFWEYALSYDGCLIEYAPDNIKKNKYLIGLAVSCKPWALKFIDEEFKKDYDIINKAVCSNIYTYPLDVSMKNSVDLAKNQLHQSSSPIHYADCSIKYGRYINLISKLLSVEGSWIKDLSDDLKNDIDLCSIAISNAPESIKYFGDISKNNKDLMLQAVEIDGLVLRFMQDYFKNDEDIVSVALRQNCTSVKYVGKDLISKIK